MEFPRNHYIQQLIIRKNNDMIKVITGIRRCGKSYLLFTLFKKHLLEIGINNSHIIEIQLDIRNNIKYRDPDKILDFIESQIVDNDTYYIMLDEVQMIPNFEDVLNTLLHFKNVDVYVTGSNSKFLSKDIITEFRGRGDEVHLYPLSFGEFFKNYNGDIYHAWSDYAMYGGLPQVANMDLPEQKVKYLTNLFEQTYIRDIIERYHIEKTQEIDDLINIIASSIGSLTNPSKIESTFRSILKSNISRNTINNYLSYLEDAFIINKANRYDVKGRKYIGTPLKYYFEDTGLRNARLGFRQNEETHLMENIIYNELRVRGFSIDVGVVENRYLDAQKKDRKGQLEIDFIAYKGSQKFYIQSAFALTSPEKTAQEKASLIKVKDSFKKIVIVKDVVNATCDDDGITTMSIYDFLLNENSLNL
ncbi:MAG: ATP-binding protein [Succinivibrionaceae bacterium]|nr:ATP-binding protein [Succinivibrionaceae bacterium]